MPSQKKRPKKKWWVNLTDEELLKLRFSDLHLNLNNSQVPIYIEKLRQELRQKGLCFNPYFWLSTGWFTPDGLPGVAIPFYLAHERLARLERNQVFEVEGGNAKWFMQILRHECGHAIDNAYRLRRRKQRQKIFGKSTMKYSPYYNPKPYSKRYVLHLDNWYSQSHPDEDFAETFAVWLTPKSNWRQKYIGWPALKKLEYMDELMGEIAKKSAPIKTKEKLDPLSKIKSTIGQHYRKKRSHLGLDYLPFYERDLLKLFSDDEIHKKNKPAARFIRQHRDEILRPISKWTGIYRYTVNQVADELITYCEELNLHLCLSENETKLNFLVMLTVQTMNYLHDGHNQVAR